jgi:hypothetical protein
VLNAAGGEFGEEQNSRRFPIRVRTSGQSPHHQTAELHECTANLSPLHHHRLTMNRSTRIPRSFFTADPWTCRSCARTKKSSFKSAQFRRNVSSNSRKAQQDVPHAPGVAPSLEHFRSQAMKKNQTLLCVLNGLSLASLTNGQLLHLKCYPRNSWSLIRLSPDVQDGSSPNPFAGCH